MSRIERLLDKYERFIALPWDPSLAGAQKVWFVVYDKTDERRLRNRLENFELATKSAGHGWVLYDLTDSFPRWMAAQEYRESYFESPDDLALLMSDFEADVVDTVKSAWETGGAGEEAVVALAGIATMFGLLKVSRIIEKLTAHIPGRLLVFYPGEHEGNNYRLLDARDGWNYLAVTITENEAGIL